MKLYEIDNQIQALLDGMGVDEATGEVVLDVEALAALQLERQTKLEGIALYIKDITAFADDIRAEEKALAERRKALEAKAERLKGYLASALGGEKLETARVRVSVGKPGKLCVVDDVYQISGWLEQLAKQARELDNADAWSAWKAAMDTSGFHWPDPEVSKAGLKKLLDQYGEIPGCHLADGKARMTIK